MGCRRGARSRGIRTSRGDVDEEPIRGRVGDDSGLGSVAGLDDGLEGRRQFIGSSPGHGIHEVSVRDRVSRLLVQLGGGLRSGLGCGTACVRSREFGIRSGRIHGLCGAPRGEDAEQEAGRAPNPTIVVCPSWIREALDHDSLHPTGRAPRMLPTRHRRRRRVPAPLPERSSSCCSSPSHRSPPRPRSAVPSPSDGSSSTAMHPTGPESCLSASTEPLASGSAREWTPKCGAVTRACATR